jgi:hypothetical protein
VAHQQDFIAQHPICFFKYHKIRLWGRKQQWGNRSEEHTEEYGLCNRKKESDHSREESEGKHQEEEIGISPVATGQSPLG